MRELTLKLQKVTPKQHKVTPKQRKVTLKQPRVTLQLKKVTPKLHILTFKLQNLTPNTIVQQYYYYFTVKIALKGLKKPKKNHHILPKIGYYARVDSLDSIAVEFYLSTAIFHTYVHIPLKRDLIL